MRALYRGGPGGPARGRIEIMPAIVCLAGPAGPEKSKILQGVASEISSRGVKASVIDEQASGNAVPQTGVETITVGEGGFCLSLNREQLSLIQFAERFLFDSQVVLSGAGSDEKRPKLEYCPDGKPTMQKDPGLRGYVSPAPVEGDKACFEPSDFKGMADYIVDELTPNKEPMKARVLIAGKNLPMKGFVQDIVADTIKAMIRSLKGGDRPGRMEIFLD